MNPLQPETFYYQYGNQRRAPRPYRRRKTYLCYQLRPLEGPILARVCLQNKKKRHAETRFIDNIKALRLDRSQRFKITCYLTWSPCPTCVEELVAFFQDHTHLSLQLFVSRLYFHWRKESQRGLKRLYTSRIPIAVMSLQEFEDCWRNFVDNRGEPFQPWNKLVQYSESTTRRLRKILINDLENDFRNLQIRGPPTPYHIPGASRCFITR